MRLKSEVPGKVRSTRALVAVGLAIAATAVVGCGSDDKATTAGTAAGGASTTASAAKGERGTKIAEVPATDAPQPGREVTGGYVYAGTAEQTAEAKTAGEKDAQGRVDAPKDKTIGIIQLSGQSAASKSITGSAQKIAKLFGFTVKVCDPNFDPQKLQQCATSIAAQQPDAVFSVSQNPGPMGSGVKQVADQGGLWFGTGGVGDPSPYINDYGIDGFGISKAVDTFMFDKIEKDNPGGDKNVLGITAPTVGIANKNSAEQLRKDVAGAKGLKLIEHNLDLANAVQDTLNTTRQTLEQHPQISAVTTLCDFCVPLMAQVVEGKQPNRKTVVVGGYSSPESIADVRAGKIDGIADHPLALAVWVGMDQALAKWARDKAPVKGYGVFGSYSLPFMDPYVITKENALKSGPAPIYGPDYETYFKTKWAKEYGITAG